MKYESKANPKQFGAVSRVSVKIENNFYTFESSLTKEFPNDIDINTIDMEKEWQLLWEELNSEVDNQINETQKVYEDARS